MRARANGGFDAAGRGATPAGRSNGALTSSVSPFASATTPDTRSDAGDASAAAFPQSESRPGPEGDALHRGDARELLGDERVRGGEWLRAPIGPLHRQLALERLPRHERRGSPDADAQAGGRRSPGNTRRRCIEQRCAGRIGQPRTDAERARELETRRDALHLADQHLHRCDHRQRRLDVGLCPRMGEEHHRAGVPVAGDGGVRAPVDLRSGPDEGPHGDARRIPHHRARQTRLARVLPVDVPPPRHLQLHPEPELAARVHLGHVGKEGRAHPGLALVHTAARGGSRCGGGGHEHGEEQARKHGWHP